MAVAKPSSAARPGSPAAGESPSRRWRRCPPGTGPGRRSAYRWFPSGSGGSGLTVTSPGARRRAPSLPAPGSGAISTATARASVAGSTGSEKVSVISSSRASPSAPSAGWLATGAERRTASGKRRSPARTVTSASAGQGVAGWNWSVRPSSQVKAPGCSGVIVTKRSGCASGPPRSGPCTVGKKRVTGSQRRRKRSGTSVTPSRAAAGRAGGGGWSAARAATAPSAAGARRSSSRGRARRVAAGIIGRSPRRSVRRTRSGCRSGARRSRRRSPRGAAGRARRRARAAGQARRPAAGRARRG